MKNLSTLFIALIFTCFTANAQLTCANALPITSGTQTITDIAFNSGQIPFPECAENYGFLRTGGRWYIFTASVDGVATVSSNITSNNNTDTRFHVYTGDCSNLVCMAGNDDIDLAGSNKTSEATFQITNGTSYYIAWDNRADPIGGLNGFDFTLSETAVSCPNDLPLTENFENPNAFYACYSMEDSDSNGTAFRQQFIDLDGDGTDNVYITNGSTSSIAKNDWFFSPPINLSTGAQYTIEFTYNGADGSFPANENLEVLLLDAPSASANVLTSLHNESGIVLTGNFSQAESMANNQSVSYTSTATGTYYLAFNATSGADTGSLLLFDFSVTNESLGISDNNLSSLVKTYNKEFDILTLTTPSNSPLSNIEIYNTLGQKVLSKKLSSTDETIDLKSIVNGIYMVKVLFKDKQLTFKLLKL